MTQNVTQWLDEIKALKQQLAEARQEREEAYASAINWQRLYETEAQQRRIEAAQAKQMLETLQQEVRKLKGSGGLPQAGDTPNLAAIQARVEVLPSDVDLRSHLIQALVDCDRLTQALETEQAEHAQTRKSLTTALGDAIDALAKGKTA
jgi:thioredoxin-like negative regulator of GroEL